MILVQALCGELHRRPKHSIQKYIKVKENLANDQLSGDNNSNKEFIIKPTIGNQVLWSVRAVNHGEICSYGIRAGLFSTPEVYEGDCAELIDWNSEFKSEIFKEEASLIKP